MIEAMNKKLIVLLILPMHLFLLYSIFDIYFTSPIISEIPTIKVLHKPLANRLVLYIIDGLRSNKIFTENFEPRNYLKRLQLRGNSWGISNTRVPTETRPGHVAIIAGFYEDISSVTKGWQENAVEFDSLFNRSSNTWSWGSPDVLPMFQKGATKGKINVFCYPPEFEDFAGNRTWELDTWVFNEVKDFFEKVSLNSDLDKALKAEGVVIFLHLLGIDVSGHSQKPHSPLYTKNLEIVSQGIENITNLIDNFYRDNKTAYLVTSDHGMTDWGSHGAGSSDETTTPVLAWGSGFYNSRTSENKLNRSRNKSSLSNLNTISGNFDSLQSDIWQADLCTLMASILGIPIPINSVGVVPIDYIDASDSIKAEILRTNILQLFLQFKTKYEQKKEQKLFYFYEYSDLPLSMAYDELKRGDKYISEGKFQEAIELYLSLSTQLLGGMTFFHKYDRFWLGFLLSSTFILWILYLATNIVQVSENKENLCTNKQWIVLAMLIFISTFFAIIEQQPYSYLIYQVVPITLLWTIVVFKKAQLQHIYTLVKTNWFFFFGVIILIESIVWSFFYRQMLSVGLLVTYLIILQSTHKVIRFRLKLQWTIVCLILLIYPNLPVIGGHNNPSLVVIGGILNCIITSKGFLQNRTNQTISKSTVLLRISLMMINIFTTYHVFFCQNEIKSGNGLSTLSQYLNWIISLSVIPLVCVSKMMVEDRLNLLFTALAIIYNLMSIYYELLFLCSLVIFSTIWNKIENKYRLENHSVKLIDRRKIIQTIIYVFLFTYSFFATGNIASINSFDVASTYCLLTVFKPFLMGFILIVKIMIPMFIISLIYVFVQFQQSIDISFSPRSKINVEEICLVTIISDFAALHFLFLIKDSGSWLDIGESISHYVITMGISICVSLFTLLAKYMLIVKSVLPELISFKSK